MEERCFGRGISGDRSWAQQRAWLRRPRGGVLGSGAARPHPVPSRWAPDPDRQSPTPSHGVPARGGPGEATRVTMPFIARLRPARPHQPARRLPPGFWSVREALGRLRCPGRLEGARAGTHWNSQATGRAFHASNPDVSPKGPVESPREVSLKLRSLALVFLQRSGVQAFRVPTRDSRGRSAAQSPPRAQPLGSPLPPAAHPRREVTFTGT